MSSVPGDVTAAILCQLPVKSIIRFKCISKRFCSLIESKDFIRLHLRNNSVDDNTKLKLIHHSETRFFCLDLTADQPNNLDGPFGHGMTKILGSSNGLLCILKWYPGSTLWQQLPGKNTTSPNIALWNPATKKFHILPPAPIEVGQLDPYDRSVDSVYAFGYDSVNDDYKILRMVKVLRNPMMTPGRVFEFMVYSLRSNSWKPINVAQASLDLLCPIFSLHRTKETYVSAHNAFHWLSYRTNGSSIIVAFDLHREEFCTLPLHDSKALPCSTLGLLGQWLSLIPSPRRSFDIWIMKEYGIKDSWVKLFSLKSASENHCITHHLPINKVFLGPRIPLAAYSKDDDNEKFLLQQLFQDILVWYDLKSNKYECVWYPAGAGKYSYVYTIVESLVSPFSDEACKTEGNVHRQHENKTNMKKRRRDEQA